MYMGLETHGGHDFEPDVSFYQFSIFLLKQLYCLGLKLLNSFPDTAAWRESPESVS